LGQIDELLRYDGRRAVVTGCASGIGAHVARQLTELGAHVVGLDKQAPSEDIPEFYTVDLTDPASIDTAVSSVGGQVDALFNIAGVSSGIGDPLLVLTINFPRPAARHRGPVGEDADRIVHRERVFACG